MKNNCDVGFRQEVLDDKRSMWPRILSMKPISRMLRSPSAVLGHHNNEMTNNIDHSFIIDEKVNGVTMASSFEKPVSWLLSFHRMY